MVAVVVVGQVRAGASVHVPRLVKFVLFAQHEVRAQTTFAFDTGFVVVAGAVVDKTMAAVVPAAVAVNRRQGRRVVFVMQTRGGPEVSVVVMADDYILH